MTPLKFHVIGVDPGGMTGVALTTLEHHPDQDQSARARLKNWSLTTEFVIEAPEDQLAKAMYAMYHSIGDVEEPLPVVTVTEKYIVTVITMSSQDTQAIEMTGIVRGVGDLWRPHPRVVDQTSSMIKSLSRQDLLDEGVTIPPRLTHGFDALRHAFIFASRWVRSDVGPTPNELRSQVERDTMITSTPSEGDSS